MIPAALRTSFALRAQDQGSWRARGAEFADRAPERGTFGPCTWPTPAPGASAWGEWGRALVFLAAIALFCALALLFEPELLP